MSTSLEIRRKRESNGITEGMRKAMKHYITKYGENGRRYAESWLQINIFGKAICFWRKKIEI